MEKPSQYIGYQPRKEYVLPIYIRRETNQKTNNLFGAGNSQKRSLEEIVLYI